MSLATRQALVQLSVVAGCFNTMKQCNCFARVDIRRLIDDTLDRLAVALTNWPCTGDPIKNEVWTQLRMNRWKSFIAADRDKYLGTVVMAKMCERILSALDEVTCNDYKRELLKPILAASTFINNYCDPEGANFPAFEKSDFLLHEPLRDHRVEGVCVITKKLSSTG